MKTQVISTEKQVFANRLVHAADKLLYSDELESFLCDAQVLTLALRFTLEADNGKNKMLLEKDHFLLDAPLLAVNRFQNLHLALIKWWTRVDKPVALLSKAIEDYLITDFDTIFQDGKHRASSVEDLLSFIAMQQRLLTKVFLAAYNSVSASHKEKDEFMCLLESISNFHESIESVLRIIGKPLATVHVEENELITV